MCNTRNSRRIVIDKRTFRVDGCIRDKLKKMNKHTTTLGSCCGHGRYPETIVVKSIDGKIREFYTGSIIPRTRRFYKKDIDGYYYIPEISKPTLSQNRLESDSENTGSEIEKEE